MKTSLKNGLQMLSLCLCALGAFVACQNKQEPQGATKQASQPSPQSKNWRVQLLSVERRNIIFEGDKQQRTAPAGKIFLRVSMKLTYLGPASLMRPPAVELVDDAGVRYARVPYAIGEQPGERKPNDSFLKSMWFYMEAEKALVEGEAMPDSIWFDFEVPEAAVGLRLIFGDVDPIPLSSVDASSKNAGTRTGYLTTRSGSCREALFV